MSFANVQTKTVFRGYANRADEAAILAVMKKAYEGSATARSAFDAWLNDPSHKIVFNYKRDALFVTPSNRELYVDVNAVGSATYITPTGRAEKDTLLSAVVHELGHALTGKPDGTAGTRVFDFAKPDYKGDNVIFVNKIYKELGIAEQVSYVAYDAMGLVHKLGYNYTNGAPIDVAVTVLKGKSYSFSGDFNSDNAAATRDLLIGDSNNNVLQSGKGNDFLVGGAGDDQLRGGDGTDTGVYLGSAIDYDIRLKSDGTWSVRHVRGLATDGGDIFQNVEKLQFDKGKVFELKKEGLTFQTDFAFVIDTTGSMGNSIDAVKKNASTMISKLFADGTTDARVGVVGFKDTTNGEPSSVILSFTDQDSFADRQSAALNAINGISVDGGGDLPETANDGLLTALNGSMGEWRAGAKTHQIALFTDAAVKDTELAGAVAALAKNLGVTISGRSSVSGSGGALFTYHFADDSHSGRSAWDETTNVGPSAALTDELTGPISGIADLQVYTIFTGGDDVDTSGLTEISAATGGLSSVATSDDDLVATLLAIISEPKSLDQILNGFDGVNDEVNGGLGNDVIHGLSGNDLLRGLDGIDDLYGDRGNDVLVGGLGADVLNGGIGSDTASYITATAGVYVNMNAPSLNKGDAAGDFYISIENIEGSRYADRLVVNDGKNALYGLGGNDVLVGGRGADKLFGGTGGDKFVYPSEFDSRPGAGRDTIYDFSIKEKDKVILNAIDADALVTGNQAFNFIGTKTFSGAAGELRFDKKASDTYVYGDINGDGKSDFSIHFDDALSVTKGYFLL